MSAIDLQVSSSDWDVSAVDKSTPVLILGGRENALSVVRRYGSAGIVTRVSGPADCWGMNSRHCHEKLPIPRGVADADYWSDLLLSGNKKHLHGSLLIACSDFAIEFLANNRAELEEHYVLDHANPKMQLALLDKRETLNLARSAGVATPQFWNVETEEDLEAVRQSVTFPVMVKPVISHEFIKVFGRKLFIIDMEFDELAEKVRLSWAKKLDVMVIEMIPGPDSLLSSYYTYMADDHVPSFDYTKCIIRRFPVNRGLACYHQSKWMPDTAEVGKKFFEGIGFTGFGNVEFKRDPRDNVLKIIECNARFTSAQELIIRAGAPIDMIYYCKATGQPAPTFADFDQKLTFWYGLRDFLAFMEMRKTGKITTMQWFKSLFPLKHVSPLHNLADPYPSFAALMTRVEKSVKRLL